MNYKPAIKILEDIKVDKNLISFYTKHEEGNLQEVLSKIDDIETIRHSFSTNGKGEVNSVTFYSDYNVVNHPITKKIYKGVHVFKKNKGIYCYKVDEYEQLD